MTSENSTKTSSFIVGIDLGTTHTVVGFISLETGSSDVSIFKIDQLIGPGKVSRLSLLPSFRYHAATNELPVDACHLPWKEKPVQDDYDGIIIGQWARLLGSKTPERLVSSAKSWLTHTGVDRESPILPLSAIDSENHIFRISPVMASASYLNHIRQAWNFHHPQALLENQVLVITIPASFDEVARNLTVNAAKMAGLIHFSLLEEPQAVCYDWQHQFQKKHLNGSNSAYPKNILVCDIGGGTTDLSLIQVSNAETFSQPQLTRIGVGRHLLLGGDNVDLALARGIEQNFSAQKKMKPLKYNQLHQLVQQCREAKEKLLSENAPEKISVTLLAEGSKLLSGIKRSSLSQESAHKTIMDGFFPSVALASAPHSHPRGVLSLGLNYESDPAITRHIAQFIQNEEKALSPERVPDSVLFNGGIFNSKPIQQHLLNQLAIWRGKPVSLLENSHPDHAVAYGAVYYGLALRGKENKIEGGSAHNYVLLLEDKLEPDAQETNGNQASCEAICLLPKGSKEGISINLDSRHFLLKTGSPVRFTIATTISSEAMVAGSIISILPNDLHILPPLISVLDSHNTDSRQIEVVITAQYTTLGTLELTCHTLLPPPHQWLLEFELRHNIPGRVTESQAEHKGDSNRIKNLASPRLREAQSIISKIYGVKTSKQDEALIKTFRPQMEKVLGNRNTWSLSTLRALCDLLISLNKQRKRSVQHERAWLNLTGFCLRPGFGESTDYWRVEKLWPLYTQGLAFDKENSSWAEWWTFWRRLSGGLNADQQNQIFNHIHKYIHTQAIRNRKLQAELKNRSFDDLLKLTASLERLNTDTKLEIGQAIVSRLEKQPEQPTLGWALGRIGSRHPLNGELNSVISPQKISEWIQQLMKANWKKHPSLAFATVMIARRTDDPMRDIDDVTRAAILMHLEKAKVPLSWLDMVKNNIKIENSVAKRMYGESMPTGIELIK